MADSALLTVYNESYAGNKTITAYNLDDYQERKFQGVLNGVFDLRMKLFQRTRWLTPVMHIILSIGIGAAIWFGSYLVLNGFITSGSLVSFLTALKSRISICFIGVSVFCFYTGKTLPLASFFPSGSDARFYP